jgi:hypothetical protein
MRSGRFVRCVLALDGGAARDGVIAKMFGLIDGSGALAARHGTNITRALLRAARSPPQTQSARAACGSLDALAPQSLSALACASALGLEGSPAPHLQQDWAHPSRSCTGSGPAPPTSTRGTGLASQTSLGRVRRDSDQGLASSVGEGARARARTVGRHSARRLHEVTAITDGACARRAPALCARHRAVARAASLRAERPAVGAARWHTLAHPAAARRLRLCPLRRRLVVPPEDALSRGKITPLSAGGASRSAGALSACIASCFASVRPLRTKVAGWPAGRQTSCGRRHRPLKRKHMTPVGPGRSESECMYTLS